MSDHNLSDQSMQTQIRHDFVVIYRQSMKTRVTIGKILKWHFKSCLDFVVFYHKSMKTRVTAGKVIVRKIFIWSCFFLLTNMRDKECLA